jgi:hypothetical protein
MTTTTTIPPATRTAAAAAAEGAPQQNLPSADTALPGGWMRMVPLAGRADRKKKKMAEAAAQGKNGLEATESSVSADMRSDDELLGDETTYLGQNRDATALNQRAAEETELGDVSTTTYKVYKRRWFGLVQIVLLNIVVSWDVSKCQLPSLPTC